METYYFGFFTAGVVLFLVAFADIAAHYINKARNKTKNETAAGHWLRFIIGIGFAVCFGIWIFRT